MYDCKTLYSKKGNKQRYQFNKTALYNSHGIDGERSIVFMFVLCCGNICKKLADSWNKKLLQLFLCWIGVACLGFENGRKINFKHQNLHSTKSHSSQHLIKLISTQFIRKMYKNFLSIPENTKGADRNLNSP